MSDNSSTETPNRKVDRGPTDVACPVHQRADGAWEVRGHAASRAVLRSIDTVQAGLGVETMDNLPHSIRRPVLYRDGAEHREHRRQTAKYFTAKRVDESYRELMERVSDELIAELVHDGSANLEALSFRLAVAVASEVVGLTNSRPGLSKRLDRFFPEKFGRPGITSINGIYWFFKQMRQFLEIYISDVRPAVKARRLQPRDDLITHLIGEGCTGGEILGECVTFAAAGMITTREFITMAAWHLLEDADLRQRFLGGDQEQRYAVLHEILRVEPVVGTLKRRTTAEVTVPGADGPVEIPSGALVDIVVSTANADPAALGEAPLQVCPERSRADGVAAQGLSLGDGAHKCPGQHLAIQETDVFLTRLFALPDLTLLSLPRITVNPATDAYELRDLRVGITTN